MRAAFILISLFVLLITSCRSKDTKPGNVLPKEKMQAVLWDIMRADQFLSDYVFSRDTAADKKKESEKMYARILSIHKISWEDFQHSFDWYSHRPGMLKPILDSIAAVPAASAIPATTPTATTPPVTTAPPVILPQGTDTSVHMVKPVLKKDTTRRRKNKLLGKPLRVQ